jgi:hypothetical protein
MFKNQFSKSKTACKIIMNPNIDAVKLYIQIPIYRTLLSCLSLSRKRVGGATECLM